MKSKFSNFVVFDIGSSKIAGLVANITKQGDVSVLTQLLQQSQGFISGIVNNMETAENNLMSAIYSLEKECNKSLKEAAISLSGNGLKSYYIQTKIQLNNQAITTNDIKRLIDKAINNFNNNLEIIHHFPLEFILDDEQAVENPIGMFAKSLICNLHIIAANKMMLINLNQCLAKCHMEIRQVNSAIYASGLACLSADEQELGSLMIDIGSHTTSYGVFFNNKLIYLNYLPIGGWHITTDIAKQLSINIQAAEKLKILYGNANPSLLLQDSVINIEESEVSITTKQLANIINQRISSIFNNIKHNCQEKAMQEFIHHKIVITGGSAATPGIKNVAAEIWQKRTRIAKPHNITGFTQSYNPHIFSTALGMLEIEALKYNRDWLQSGNYDHNHGWFKKTLMWIKENI